MSTPSHSSLPPELQDDLQQKTPDEQARIKRVWQLLGHLEEDDSVQSGLIPDTEAALQDIERSLDSGESTPAPVGLGKRARRAPDRQSLSGATNPKERAMQWTTMSAAVTLALFACMIWFWRIPVVVQAPLGEQVTTVLPDQSVITLNSGSRIEYARRFESWPLISTTKRRVYLQGEAFFEVEEMDVPFVVESFNAQVRVLGTSFNVWAREHDATPETRVALKTGTVLVTSHQDEAPLDTLAAAGDMARVVTRPNGRIETVASRVPVEQADAWRSNGFAIQDLSIASIVAEIERRYVMDITLDPTIDAEHKLNLFVKDPTPAELLESICLSVQCQFRETSNGFSIFTPPSGNSQPPTP
ncbi:MAG: FecR domain-containing protein [Bacteroidota bacterium]